MPQSIDLASYEKAPMLEEPWTPDGPTSSSSDDGDDTLPMLKKKKPWPKHPIRWIRSPWLFLLDLVLVALATIFYSRKPATSYLDWTGDITGFVPRFSQSIVTFQAYPKFVSNHSSIESLAEAREQWMNLLPPGQGYVKVDDATINQYDIPKPIEYKGGKSVGTSMMHGLHCLYLIMSEYDMLALGMREPPVDTWHMDHCIDYVRQLLLCGGDMALAGEDLPNGSSFLNVPHVCKNFDQIYNWLDDHKDNNQYQFGSHETHYVPP